MRLSDFHPTPKSSWAPPKLSSLPSWRGAKRVGIDTETRDPQLTSLGCGARRDGRMVGISFAIQGGPSHYLPFGHEGGGNLPKEAVLAYIREQAKEFDGELLGANMGYDADYFEQAGIHFRPRRWRDVQVIEPLLDELRLSYSFDSILHHHRLPGKDESLLQEAAAAYGLDPKKDLWRMHSRFVGPYAEADAQRLFALLESQEKQISAQGLDAVYDRECQLVPVLIEMRSRGVAVDLEYLDQIERWALAEECQALNDITAMTGVRLGVGDAGKKAALMPIMIANNIKLPKTESGQESITSAVLDGIDAPWAEKIRRARKFNKLRTTFVQSVRDHQVKGRIHCTLRQAVVQREDGDGSSGARFGRLSCTDPNLQQQPARDPEIGPIWRKIYLPDNGGRWSCLDYSQQEPRWTFHYAELLRCKGAAAIAEQYRKDPNTDSYTLVSKITGRPRDQAKGIFLGRLYGMGGAKYCRQVGLPTRMVKGRRGMVEVAGPEGQAQLDEFDSRLPLLAEVSRIAMQKAESRGYVMTAGGRRCRFPRDPKSGKIEFAYKALNRVIQGSAGDQMRAAMVLAHEAGIKLQLQVHDELDQTTYGVGSEDETLLLAEIMRNALPCNVPHKIDNEQGPNWGTLTKIKS